MIEISKVTPNPNSTQVDLYLKVLRQLKYGVLEHIAEEDEQDKVIVIEAPRFNSDLYAVCTPVYLESDTNIPTKIYQYYQKSEALLRQRFAQLQIKRIISSFHSFVYQIKYDLEITTATVIFDGRKRPLLKPTSYDFDLFQLIHLTHDLLEYGDLLAKEFCDSHCGFYPHDLVRAISEHVDFTPIGWQIIEKPLSYDPSSKLTVRQPRPSNPLAETVDINYPNTVDGLNSFILRLFTALTNQPIRDFLADPNLTEEELLSKD